MRPPPLGITARGEIKRVIDGDTVEVICLGVLVTIRLRDCWAPEIHGIERARGLVAKQFMEQTAPPGSACIVRIFTGEAEKLSDLFSFGRPIGEVWLRGEESSLSELMVASGFATKEKQK
jgi:endonuclease YncB( thermonuclease family)